MFKCNKFEFYLLIQIQKTIFESDGKNAFFNEKNKKKKNEWKHGTARAINRTTKKKNNS